MTQRRQVRLSRRFYQRAPELLARALLGKAVVIGEQTGIIVETEAYLGTRDLASHARFGLTQRNRVMFGQAGVAYVYLCYGMHNMLNVVSGREGDPGAVLIRALDLGSDPALARGPGKLTRALGVTREHNSIDLVTDDHMYIRHDRRINPDRIARGPRIGVDYAGAWADALLRFWIADHPAVSRRPGRSGRRLSRSATSRPTRPADQGVS